MGTALAVPVGLAVGLLLGLLGAGGSLLTVPALTLLLGLGVAQATGTSLVAVAMMATAGVLVHRGSGRCRCREGAVFGAATAVTAATFGRVGAGLPDRLLAVAFVVLLLGTVAWLLTRDDVDRPTGADAAGGLPMTLAAGGGIGVLTGLLGVGGGFIVVPALVATRGLPMPVAVGTSQLVVLVSALAGLAGRLGTGTIQWPVGLLFGLGGVVGAAAGARASGRVGEAALRRTFAALAAAVAVVMAADALTA